jgi:AAA15 family ATPase/GTPase
MILSLKIKNFLSFKDEVTFSFEATKDKSLEEYQVVEVAPGVRISKLGVVYGANASGKSNLVKAFDFLKKFWTDSPNSKDEETFGVPFLLDDTSRDKPSEFELVFYIEGRKHIYSLKITSEYVISETLIQYPSIRPAEIFSRTLIQNISEIRFNANLKINALAKKEIEVKCLTNMSIFAAYSKVNVHLPEMAAVISWMKYQMQSSIIPKARLIEFVKELILSDNKKKSSVLKFLNQADFNITNIDVLDNKISTASLADSEGEKYLPNPGKDKSGKRRSFGKEIVFSHNVIDKKGNESVFLLPEWSQSDGTLRIMEIAGVLSLIIEQNAFVAIDEIESSLHPKLIEFFIESFLKQSKTAQLLLTTHYDGLLEEEDLLRNDNIWFTNKRKDGSTELYSLSDFKGVNRISSLQKAYKYGKFGAVPNI